MATARNISIQPTTFTAGVDFSACPTQIYRFVRAGSIAGEVLLGAAASPILGVIQNSPSTGQEASVMLLGPTKLVMDVGTCNAVFGRYVHSASDGQGETDNACGVAQGVYLGSTVTSGSFVGEIFFYGLTTCLNSGS